MLSISLISLLQSLKKRRATPRDVHIRRWLPLTLALTFLAYTCLYNAKPGFTQTDTGAGSKVGEDAVKELIDENMLLGELLEQKEREIKDLKQAISDKIKESKEDLLGAIEKLKTERAELIATQKELSEELDFAQKKIDNLKNELKRTENRLAATQQILRGEEISPLLVIQSGSPC